MPLYVFADKKTGKEINVIRDMDDRDTEPTSEEIAQAKLELENPEWERLITSTKFTRGPGWNYQKGLKN